MIFTRRVKQEVEVTHLLAVMGVRYWEDALVNGVDETDDSPKMPFAQGETWKILIELETGKIVNWPVGTTASTHYKVADAGVYSLLDAAGNVITSKDGYVPRMLCPKRNGYGDYVIMDIGPDGQIDGWRVSLSYFTGDE